ncbi:unnamed protein product [Arabidopsis thaliana]|uniref:F-box domain-containing protein n=1 Tax=Arabidopsis thaliana TaxID=3702 RepID=A0A5S9Y7H1_ARATH|nr:unnamed protein product [Arabidopsis thaliana]
MDTLIIVGSMVTLWSEIPMDILRSVFERLSFVDLHRAKIVCSHWYSCSKQSLLRKTRSPLVILFSDDGDCTLYNPEEARVYKSKRDLSRYRFLANSGNWFLVLDPRSNLYIIDLFSEKKINLPPLDSFKGYKYNLKKVGARKFKELVSEYPTSFHHHAKDLRGLLWVDEKKEEYVVVWYFRNKYTMDSLAFCKNGEDHYREMPTHYGLHDISDMVLQRGDHIYLSTSCKYLQKLDLSRQEGIRTKNDDIISRYHLPCRPTNYKLVYDAKCWCSYNIAVTSSGEVLFVLSIFSQSTRRRIFFLYKEDPNPSPSEVIYKNLVEVDSLGDEALLLDLGITVPADSDLGIEPNSIYFTRHDRVANQKRSSPDICVFNIVTKTLKRFPGLSSLKDARWFLPS